MNLQGKIKSIGETQTFGSGFKKRELVLTTQEQYPQDILIEFTQEKTEVLNGYNVNDSVEIGINLRGREWINPEGVAKYFNSIVGWKISNFDSRPQTNQEPLGKDDKIYIGNAKEHQKEAISKGNDSDDLPF